MGFTKGVMPPVGRQFQFKKGESGNPAGRSRAVREVTELARTYSDEAVKLLGEIMRDVKAPPSVRLTAVMAILDRAAGKPVTTVDMGKRDIDAHEVKVLSDNELYAYLAASGVVLDSNGGNGAAGASTDETEPS